MPGRLRFDLLLTTYFIGSSVGLYRTYSAEMGSAFHIFNSRKLQLSRYISRHNKIIIILIEYTKKVFPADY